MSGNNAWGMVPSSWNVPGDFANQGRYHFHFPLRIPIVSDEDLPNPISTSTYPGRPSTHPPRRSGGLRLDVVRSAEGGLTPDQNQKRYLARAVDACTCKLTWIEGERKNSTLFLLLIHQLVTVSSREARRIHIILDNFKIHDSRQAQMALAAWDGKVRFHLLPLNYQRFEDVSLMAV